MKTDYPGKALPDDTSFRINDQQKIRLSFSEAANCVIGDDMKYYGVSQPATFINTVFENFYPTARSSVALQLEKKEADLEQQLGSLDLAAEAKTSVIAALLQEEKKKLEQMTETFRTSKGTSRLFRLNKQNAAYLSHHCPESLLETSTEDCGEQRKKLYANPAQYVKSVIEEYCSLPFIERDRIYHKEHYRNIETACREKKVLKIRIPCYVDGSWVNRTYQVHPYKIVPDAFHIQSYLVCRSKQTGEEESSRKVASFTISRLQEPPAVMESGFFISSKEKKEIEERLLRHSPAFMIEEIEEIHVKLTEKGKLSYQNRRYSRPVRDETLSTEDEYVFFCPSQQAYSYFVSFGPEAEVLSPLPLRERFTENFRKALDVYT